MLKLCKTFETWDEEARELGETDERGFVWQDVPHGVREAAALLRGRQPSQWPITNPARCWFTDPGEPDSRTGETEENALHFSHSNSPHALRYWAAAIRAAGFEVRA